MTNTFLGVRQQIVSYLQSELTGPRWGDNEELGEAPFRYYTTGILYPQKARPVEISPDAEKEETETASVGSTDDDREYDPVTLANDYLPASLGLSFFLRTEDVPVPEISISISTARYLPTATGSGTTFKRTPMNADPLILPLEQVSLKNAVWNGIADVYVVRRKRENGWLVTVCVVNTLPAGENGSVRAENCLHQTSLIVTPGRGTRFVPYPTAGMRTSELEEEILMMLYHKEPAYATGHGCAAGWTRVKQEAVAAVYTEYMPMHGVKGLDFSLPGFDDLMQLDFLGADNNGDLLIGRLTDFTIAYREWIAALPRNEVPDNLLSARDAVISRLEKAAQRMEDGVYALQTDEQVLKAFRWANRAMADQMRHATEPYAKGKKAAGAFTYVPPVGGYPKWRPFQLAFLLLVLTSVAYDDDDDRTTVDLIWFPTGGGKTEAYLAVTAFLLILRRLRHPEKGTGTAVIMRYTLRLLTAQQFQRAATLICALELLRRTNEAELGNSPFSIGLWVGEKASPNKNSDAAEMLRQVKSDPQARHTLQPDQCPWCGTALLPAVRSENDQDYGFRATATGFKLHCPTQTCPFAKELPVNIVDDALYANPPSVLLATVDKFAQLPRTENPRAFFGEGKRLPPQLIIQDELHLISGPLGTMVGLYETAIDLLCQRDGIRPKIIASTATIRRADEQCAALYAREPALFPPAGLSADDSYFARTDPTGADRLYIGVTAPGHSGPTAVIRTMAVLLQAPVDLRLTGKELDAYWTMVAYHNSLRELGKTLNFARDDIPARLKVIARTSPRDLRNEYIEELNSSAGGAKLVGVLNRLTQGYNGSDPVALLACSNMLSVGVDVSRLALLVMHGQPKSTSEYIQATSRVGRSTVPGLVITVYSAFKPRDRSHYEQFHHYHATLYRHVEPTAVTPFSPPARTRALHAVLVTFVRYMTELRANTAAREFDAAIDELQILADAVRERVRVADPDEEPETLAELQSLIKEWDTLAATARLNSQTLVYKQGYGIRTPALLKEFKESDRSGWETLNSLRNVDEESVLKVI